jgi:hypothetical protein
MSKGSFSRTVARAASSGGSRAYRGRSPRAWYALIAGICVLGVFLIVYSRQEALHPYKAPAVQPTASDHWYAALGIDLCGKVQPNLPENPNFSTVGIRTAGDGVILISPGAVSNASSFTGKHDTLGTFALNYPGFDVTATSLQVPGVKTVLKNGDACTSALGPRVGKAHLEVETWSSAHAKKGTTYTGDPTDLKLNNGMMITVGFVPKGTTLPQPPSKQALLADLNGTAVSSSPTTPPTTTSTSTSTIAKATTSTIAGATTSSVAGATTSSVAGATTTLAATASSSSASPSTTLPAKASPKATVPPGEHASPTTSATSSAPAATSSTSAKSSSTSAKH